LEQVATPRQLYEVPNSRWIAEFVGGINIIDGEVESRDAGRVTVATQAAGQVTAAAPVQALTTDQVCVAIRPEKVRLSRGEATSDAGHAAGINRLEGVISGISYLGGQTRYQVRLDRGALLSASVANNVRREVDAYDKAERVVVCFAPDDCMVLDR
jgi:putrescine transport system ATP-binding protein